MGVLGHEKTGELHVVAYYAITDRIFDAAERGGADILCVNVVGAGKLFG
ncbi:hypothetical protein [Pseudoflavonifractor sp. An85]|nr:hypothetical protein [Pseudoflavonifractor sp. An85]